MADQMTNEQILSILEEQNNRMHSVYTQLSLLKFVTIQALDQGVLQNMNHISRDQLSRLLALAEQGGEQCGKGDEIEPLITMLRPYAANG